MKFFGIEIKFNGFDIWHKGNQGHGSGLDADTIDGWHTDKLAKALPEQAFGGTTGAITTAEFITMITNMGAFNDTYWATRGQWWYDGNKYISDTGIGTIHLAGSTVEVFGASWGYTIRIHTATTSAYGVVDTEFIYVNNGPTYSPGWRKIWNDKNDGAGSGLDADLLDGNHASAFATSAQGTKADNALPSSSYTASDVLTKIKTVDGSSSGLDADLLDGNHASAFALTTSVPTKLSQLQNDIGAGGGIKITTNAVAPSSPSPGDFWYKV